jgi:hypothetical protein
VTAPLLLGAVAYDPKVVTIWEGFRVWFAERDAGLGANPTDEPGRPGVGHA